MPEALFNGLDLWTIDEEFFIGEAQHPPNVFIGCVFVDEDVAEVGEESESVVGDGERPAIFAHGSINFIQSVFAVRKPLFVLSYV